MTFVHFTFIQANKKINISRLISTYNCKNDILVTNNSNVIKSFTVVFKA